MGYGPYFAPPDFTPTPPAFAPPYFYSSSLSVSLSVTSTTSNSITVSWTMTGTNIQANSYTVEELSISSGQTVSGYTGTTGSFTFSGLSPATSYTIFISVLATDTVGTTKFASTSTTATTTSAPPSVSISATRTTPTNVSITYSVSAPAGSGTVTWSISGTGSPYTSNQTLAAGSTTTETVNATVTPGGTRYLYTISASNSGGNVSASDYDLDSNPSTFPSGNISVGPTTLYTTLNVSISVNSPSGANNGRTFYTVSGTGLSESGSLPQLVSETFDYTTSSTLTPGTSYTYTLTVTNNRGTATYTASGTTKSVQPPTNLTVSSITSTSASVSWNASATAGATYVVSATGGTVNYTSGTTATITGLSPNTSYTVSVYAADSGYVSSTVSASFTTQILRTITASISATSSTDGTSAVISWSVTKSSGVTISVIEVYGPSVDSAGGATTGSVTAVGLSPGGTYTWYISVLGYYGSQSLSDSKSVTLTMNQPVAGVPSAPRDFTAKATSTGTVSLTWGGSTSAGGYPPVTYYLSGPGTIDTPITTNNYATVTGLSAGTTYTWSIYAKNTNPSTPNTSATVSATATTLSSNIGTAAIVPNITATSNAAGTEAVVTWSTVIYGTTLYYLESDVSADGLSFYASSPSGSQTVTGLTPGSTYTFRMFVSGFTRTGSIVAGSDTYVITMSNPSPVTPPAPITDKIYYHNGSTWVQASEVQVYNGSWVPSSIKTSDGKGNWT